MANKKDPNSKDLGYYNIQANTFEYKVYFDSINEKSAAQAIPHLYKLYEEILKYSRVQGDSIKWADVAFVNNEGYISPAFGNTRWLIQNQDSTKLSTSAKNKIYSLIPHEQVHTLQQQNGVCQKLPRWFEEGQAVWMEDKVLSRINPKIWEEGLLFLKKEYDKAVIKGEEIPVKIWGGMGFSIDAIKKQLTPEGIEYLEKLGTTPPGVTISLTPEDAIDNHSIISHAANYYKSYLIFKALENGIGTQELIIWNSEVIKECYSSSQIVNSLKSKCDFDI